MHVLILLILFRLYHICVQIYGQNYNNLFGIYSNHITYHCIFVFHIYLLNTSPQDPTLHPLSTPSNHRPTNAHTHARTHNRIWHTSIRVTLWHRTISESELQCSLHNFKYTDGKCDKRFKHEVFGHILPPFIPALLFQWGHNNIGCYTGTGGSRGWNQGEVS